MKIIIWAIGCVVIGLVIGQYATSLTAAILAGVAAGVVWRAILEEL